jgi:diguanylate cyclase (GGDEF)-like protein/PAS domain S-box-containing protein
MEAKVDKKMGVRDLGEDNMPVSARRKIRKRTKLELNLQRLINSISSNFIIVDREKIDKKINQVLRIVGKILQADRIYLFSLLGEEARIEKCYEFCQQGINAKIKRMQGYPACHFSWLARELNKTNKIIKFFHQTPKAKPGCDAEEEKGNCNQGLLVPINLGTYFSFLGFESRQAQKTRSKREIALFKTIGKILISALERERAEDDYRKAQEKYQSLVENIDEIIFSLDGNGHIIYISPVIESMISHKLEEIIGLPLNSIFSLEEPSLFIENLDKSLAGDIHSFEFQVMTKEGKNRDLRISSRLLFKEGKCKGLIGTLSDVSEQKIVEKLFTRAENQYQSIFENSVEGIFQCTSDDKFIVANPSCARILGYASPAELITNGRNDLFFANAGRREEFHFRLNDQGVVRDFEYEIYPKEGIKIFVSVNARLLGNTDGNGFFYEGTIQDITHKKRAEARIKFLSFHDKLTGLYNRAYFEEELKRWNTNRQFPISLIIGDVNGLKLINDAFGHKEGDRLLKKIAAILRESCRKEDLVARLGGDEFGIFLPKTNDRVAVEITNRIKLSCANASQGPIGVSIALGAVTKMDFSQDFQNIMKETEDRMYRNKLLESKSVRSSIISSLRHTLFAKSYETETHTQRLKQLAIQIGRSHGLADSVLDELSLLATLHDIGKVAIPEETLIKPGKLTQEEWEIIWKHPEIGYRIAGQLPELAPIAEGILAHHEWWDGAGYPRGLKGEDIPLISRILSVVDAYDAMTNGRSYKKAVRHQEALEELKRGAGSQFDPEIVAMFLKVVIIRGG